MEIVFFPHVQPLKFHSRRARLLIEGRVPFPSVNHADPLAYVLSDTIPQSRALTTIYIYIPTHDVESQGTEQRISDAML